MYKGKGEDRRKEGRHGGEMIEGKGRLVNVTLCLPSGVPCSVGTASLERNRGKEWIT